MMRKMKRWICTFGILGLLLGLTAGCEEISELFHTAQEILGKNGEIKNTFQETFAYIQRFGGAGSKYSIDLKTDGSFSLTVDGTTTSGTYKNLKTGFVQLTADGKTTYGLVVPGFTFVMKKLDGDGLVPMVYTGSCSEASFTANWILVKAGSQWSPSSSESPYFGSFSLSKDDGSMKLVSQYPLAAPSKDLGAAELGKGSCSNGFMEVTGDGTYFTQLNAWQTTIGGSVLHVDPDNGDKQMIVLALPQKSTNVAALGGVSFAGIYYKASSDSSVPVTMTVNSSGEGNGYRLSDITKPDSRTDAVNVSFETPNQPGPGMVLGKIAGSHPVACIVQDNAANSGKAIAFCVGQDSDGGHANLFLVQQPDASGSGGGSGDKCEISCTDAPSICDSYSKQCVDGCCK